MQRISMMAPTGRRRIWASVVAGACVACWLGCDSDAQQRGMRAAHPGLPGGGTVSTGHAGERKITTTQSALHPYFRMCRDLAYPQDDGATLRWDGAALPVAFTVYTRKENPTGTSEAWGPLRFVLVRPERIVVDDIDLSVQEAFYVATTVLTIRQAYNLEYIGVDTPELWRRFLDTRLAKYPLEDMEPGAAEALRAFFAEPRNPILDLGVEGAGRAMDVLSQLSGGMIVRLPSLGEWFAAMRAGRHARFWWGDEWDSRHVVFLRTTYAEPLDLAHAVRAVMPAESGAVNPLGLYHMLDNVGQMVWPSDVERSTLRGYYGPNAVWAKDGKYRFDPRYIVGQHSAMTMGSSVEFTPRMMEHACSGVALAVASQRYTYFSGGFVPGPDFVGLRPVIELPRAESAQARRSTSDGPRGRSAPDSLGRRW